ncbi:hypothetical protein P154DRAFT_336048 [Amniculicola lignicola CBS 123094]|uniref:Uncharacterized protein n=1 Tax=Amniculicola lignicola CBS 123094 TaxID=1392246 RepID=A0A6A5W1H5_9PLEO|nr:hypothetical protein P154DRAFT_336048 [Amniculicola lignicola CBS 123094]
MECVRPQTWTWACTHNRIGYLTVTTTTTTLSSQRYLATAFPLPSIRGFRYACTKMSQSTKANSFPFLALPPEIRIMIYKRIPIVVSHHKVTDSLLYGPPEKVTLVTKSVAGISILATCREVHAEASPILRPLRDSISNTSAKMIVSKKIWKLDGGVATLDTISRQDDSFWTSEDRASVSSFRRKHADMFLSPAGAPIANSHGNRTTHFELVVLADAPQSTIFFTWNPHGYPGWIRVGQLVPVSLGMTLHAVFEEGGEEDEDWEEEEETVPTIPLKLFLGSRIGNGPIKTLDAGVWERDWEPGEK